MSFLVIVDNGEDYSDHRHWPVCTCATLEDAKAAKARYDDWKTRALAAVRGDEENDPSFSVKWERAKAFAATCPYPVPFSSEDYSQMDVGQYYCGIIEVPEWARE